jgi:hypothetical protein
MPIGFANPWGLLALLGLPVVLAIHFLQRRRRVIPATTLFLLRETREESRAGRRFERLLPSLPMWLQLALVVLLALFLAQPTLPAAGSVQRVAIVVDASASMGVFGDEAAEAVAGLARRFGRAARRLEWLVLPSDLARPRLYAGDSLVELVAALAAWQPTGGPDDPAPALRLARDQIGPGGVLVFLTDTPRGDLPAEALLVAVGRPLANTGITGVEVVEREGVLQWEALVANRGPSPVARGWRLLADDSAEIQSGTLALEPGGMATLAGPLPAAAERCELVFEPDEFALDDRFPFVRPLPKPLVLPEAVPPEWEDLAGRVERGLAGVRQAGAGENPDLIFAAIAAEDPPPLAAGLVCARGIPGGGSADVPVVVAAVHPWLDGSSWETLAVSGAARLPAVPGDQVLVWGGGDPLVSLREWRLPAPEGSSTPGPRTRQLVFHFDPRESNLARLPAAAVLLVRFLEDFRRGKPAAARLQLETGQALAPLLPAGGTGRVLERLDRTGRVVEAREVVAGEASPARAPDQPCFLRVRDGGTILLEAAAAFAEAREGDLRNCGRADTLDLADAAAGTAAGATGPWWPLALLICLGLLLGSWAAVARRAEPIPPMP